MYLRFADDDQVVDIIGDFFIPKKFVILLFLIETENDRRDYPFAREAREQLIYFAITRPYGSLLR